MTQIYLFDRRSLSPVYQRLITHRSIFKACEIAVITIKKKLPQKVDGSFPSPPEHVFDSFGHYTPPRMIAWLHALSGLKLILVFALGPWPPPPFNIGPSAAFLAAEGKPIDTGILFRCTNKWRNGC